MTGIVAWVTFAVMLVELAAVAGAVMLARRAWRQVGPQVKPLLAMFTPPPAASVTDPGPPKSPPGP